MQEFWRCFLGYACSMHTKKSPRPVNPDAGINNNPSHLQTIKPLKVVTPLVMLRQIQTLGFIFFIHPQPDKLIDHFEEHE